MVAMNGTVEPVVRTSLFPQEELEDVQHNEVIADYESEASEPIIESDAQEMKVYSNKEYAVMELPKDGTLESHMIHRDTINRIQHAHAAQRQKIMGTWLQEMYA